MTLSADEITWILTREAADAVAHLRRNAAEYEQLRIAFRELMTAYFNAVPGCLANQGATINPIGLEDGCKLLKVRFNTPGQGRSGSLRLAVLANCDSKVVIIKKCFPRKDNVGTDAY